MGRCMIDLGGENQRATARETNPLAYTRSTRDVSQIPSGEEGESGGDVTKKGRPSNFQLKRKNTKSEGGTRIHSVKKEERKKKKGGLISLHMGTLGKQKEPDSSIREKALVLPRNCQKPSPHEKGGVGRYA